MPARKLKIICLNDPHVRTLTDSSNVKGEISSQRQAIQRILGKKVVLEDGRKMAAFMLAEAPPGPLYPDDEWDDANLKDRDGRFIVPGPEWLAERARRVSVDSERQKEFDEKAKDLLKQDVANKITDLIGLINATRPAAAAAEKPKADEKGKAGK